MKEKIVLIDADSLIFYSSKDTIEESIQNLKQRISSIIEKTESNKFILFLTGSKCFRYDIFPEYKIGRKKVKKPPKKPLKYIKTLKAFLLEEYKSCLIQELEADDLVAYYYSNLLDFETVVSSPDKDVLGQLVGTHYNYGKDEFVEVATQKEADRFLAFQLLYGDPGDDIPGLAERTQYMKKKYGLDNRKGVGEVTANKILDIIDEEEGNYAQAVLNCYISKYGDLKDEDAKNEGFNDYTLQRMLLQLKNVAVGPYAILKNYEIEKHVNDVKNEIIDEEIEDF